MYLRLGFVVGSIGLGGALLRAFGIDVTTEPENPYKIPDAELRGLSELDVRIYAKKHAVANDLINNQDLDSINIILNAVDIKKGGYGYGYGYGEYYGETDKKSKFAFLKRK